MIDINLKNILPAVKMAAELMIDPEHLHVLGPYVESINIA